MAILASDLKLLASERMTDLPDGGGYASTVEVLDNVDNNVHPDIGSGDCVAGRDWARGLYAGVRTPDNDPLIGARVYIASYPSNPATSDVLMPAPAYAASRAEAMEEVYYETQLGSNTHLRLKQDVGVGATVLPFYYLSTQTSPVTYTPKVGDRITLKEGSEQQTVLVTGIWTATISGTPTINLLSLTIAPALQHVFHGEYKTSNTSEDLGYVSPLQAYFVAAVGAKTVGIAKLSAGASIGATTITVDRLSEYVAPQANVITPGLAYPENVAGVYGSKVIITTATAIRTQTVTLPSSGTISRVSYRKNGKWVSLDNVYYGTGTTLVATLPEVPDAGSKIVWSYAGGTTGDTKIVFLLKGPVSTGSLALTAQTVATGAVLAAADNGSGALTGDATGTVDYTTGLVDATWSSAVLLKAVADYTYQESNLEGDSDLLGVDLSRAPSGMKAPIFRTQSDIVIHHTLSDTLANPVVAGATYTLGRSNVNRIWLEDATGTQIPTAKYTANLTAGSVTMAGVLDLSAYTQPLKAYNEIRDEAMVIKIEGSVLTLNQALQHAYSATVSFVSSLLRFGDLFASVTAPFSQQAWASVWSDTRIGDPITPQYDDINFPMTVTNQGAITERWRFHFVSTTLVNVIGERVGQIATNVSITGTIAPVNPHTGAPYFTIPSGGWGAGWVNGNLLRINTVSADAMFWALRVTQPSLSPPPATPDRFRLVFIGDVDA